MIKDKLIRFPHNLSSLNLPCINIYSIYLSAYTPVQVEECKENFLKECQITFSEKVQEVSVDVCTQPLVKNCDRQVDN